MDLCQKSLSIKEVFHRQKSEEGKTQDSWKVNEKKKPNQTVKSVSGNVHLLSWQHVRERQVFLWNAKQDKCGLNSLCPPATTITAVTTSQKPEKQIAECRAGCWTAGLCCQSQEDTRNCGCKNAWLGYNPFLGSMLHPDGVGESKSNNSLYIKAEVFFTLILGEKLSMSLLCSFTASRRFQTSSKTNQVLPPPISHCQEQHHNTHKAQQYGTHLYSSQCKYCYLPEVTQELCERNEVSLFSGAAVVPLPPCQ